MPYVPVGNLCLSRVIFSQKSWEEARQYCKRIDGDLLTFSSANEFATVASFLSKMNVPQDVGFWIGGRTVNNIWTWVNNNTMPLGTPFWAIIPILFESNNRQSIAYYVQQGKFVSSNQCAAMSPEFHFYLSGEDCWKKKFGLCQHSSDGEGTRQHGHEESHPWRGQHGFQHGGYVGHHGGHGEHHDGYVGHHGGHGGHHGGHWGHDGGHHGYHGYFGHHGSPDRHHDGHFGHHGLYDDHHHEYFGYHGGYHNENGEGIKENGDGDEGIKENGDGDEEIKENGDGDENKEDEEEAEENSDEEEENGDEESSEILEEEESSEDENPRRSP
nr:histidine-rich glycoprotein-like [Penaeus vannamei]